MYLLFVSSAQANITPYCIEVTSAQRFEFLIKVLNDSQEREKGTTSILEA